MNNSIISEDTKKMRKSLLLSCLIGFSISELGLIIEKISVLSTEISITSFDSVPFILSIIIFYFLFSFCINGIYEYSQYFVSQKRVYLNQISNGEVYEKEEIRKNLDTSNQDLAILENQLTIILDPKIKSKIQVFVLLF